MADKRRSLLTVGLHALVMWLIEFHFLLSIILIIAQIDTPPTSNKSPFKEWFSPKSQRRNPLGVGK